MDTHNTMTDEEIMDYLSLSDCSPQMVRRVAAVNAMIAENEELRRRVAALEFIRDEWESGDPEERAAFCRALETNEISPRESAKRKTAHRI